MWQWCQFPEDLGGIITWFFPWPQSSTFLGHFARNQPPPQTIGKMTGSPLLKVGKTQVLWHTLLWLLSARLHFNFSTSYSMLCRCHFTAGFKHQDLCISSGGNPREAFAYNITELRSGAQPVRAQRENKSLLYGPWKLHQGSFLLCLGREENEKRGNHMLQGIQSIFAGCLTHRLSLTKSELPYLSI